MIYWRDAMSLGVAALDVDRKRMIDLMNAVEANLTANTAVATSAVLGQLAEHAEAQFRREEVVLIARNFPELEAHQKEHRGLVAKLRLLQDKLASAPAAQGQIASVLHDLLKKWLVDHFIKEDTKLRRQVKPRPAAAPVLPDHPFGMPAEPNEEERKQRRAARAKDVEYELPPHLAHLLQRLDYLIPQLPPPENEFDSFEKLCAAAICRRIDKVTVFFQRHNPALERELPTFFLAAPEFAEKFRTAVEKLIFPRIWESRQVRMLSTSFNWAENDSETFWQHVGRQLQDGILESWRAAWDELKLVEVKKPDGTRVMQVKDDTKALREILTPSDPNTWDMPKVGNREIETFQSFLDPSTDWSERLERVWQVCHDLYEQEKDPRVFQQKAREGALRDGLLGAFNRCPEKWVDFLLLACHRVFPRVSTQFLESFTTNLGRTEAEREVHLPYTIRYLRQVWARPDIRNGEMAEEGEWSAKMQELRNYLRGRSPDDLPARS